MSAVRGVCGINVGVVVGVIVRKRNFFVIVEIVRSALGKQLSPSVVINGVYCVFNIGFLKSAAVLGHILKRLVRRVKTCIEHGDNHPLAVIIDALGVIDAGGIDVCVIFNRNLGHVVILCVINVRNPAHFADCIVCLRVYLYGKRVGNSAVCVLKLIVDTVSAKSVEESGMVRLDGRLHLLSLYARRIGRKIVIAGACLKGVVKSAARKLYDNPAVPVVGRGIFLHQLVI